MQFPLVPAEAITIHKSQGSTYDFVCIDISGYMTRALLYVACSRVTNISGLYLIGNFDPPKYKEDVVDRELNYLRENKKLILHHSKIYSMDSKNINIFYHNVQSLNKHYLDIIADETFFLNTTLILFLETWSVKTDSFNFKDYIQFYRKDSTNSNIRCARGILCLIRKDRFNEIVFIDEICDSESNTENLDIILFSIKKYLIILVHKSPRYNINKAFNVLQNILNTHKQTYKEFIILGDLNIDLKIKNVQFEKLFEIYNLRNLFSITQSTTNSDTQIDWLLSNISDKIISSEIYESSFSHHNPIFLSIRNFNCSIENESTVIDILNNANTDQKQIRDTLKSLLNIQSVDNNINNTLNLNIPNNLIRDCNSNKSTINDTLINSNTDQQQIRDTLISLSTNESVDNMQHSNIINTLPVHLNIPNNLILELNDTNLELSDEVVDLFIDIICAQTNYTPQSTLVYYEVVNINSVCENKDDLQILYSGLYDSVGHWVCIYYNSNIKKLFVYDSFFSCCLSTQLSTIINQIYPFINTNTDIIHKKPLYKQHDAVSCGLYAILYAISICYGDFPHIKKYNISSPKQIRNYLTNILKKRSLFKIPF